MYQTKFPIIDPIATGENIVRLRKAKGLTVRDLQSFFGFEEPQAIYKWQKGKSLPTVDNLYALGALLEVPIEEILVPMQTKLNIVLGGQQDYSCCSNHFLDRLFWIRQNFKSVPTYFDHAAASVLKQHIQYRLVRSDYKKTSITVFSALS